MKRIVLFRHAKSSWGDDSVSDHDRPLATRGLNDAPRMGTRIAAAGLQPDLILTSSATRAQQTAQLITPAFAAKAPEQATAQALYLATPGEILTVLGKLSDSIRETIVIGHNPGLTQLANMMLSDLRLDNLPTAGAVAVNCNCGSWQELDQAIFDLQFYDYPKNPSAV